MNKEQKQFWGELKHIQILRGFKLGWVSNNYKKKFGEYPPYEHQGLTLEPSEETLEWIEEERKKWFAEIEIKKQGD